MLQASCKSLPDNPPVPADKMTKILLDIQIAETYSMGLGDSVTNKFEKNYDSLGIFYHSIFKRYNVSFEEFKEAMQWYEKRPPMMDSLLTNVINELSVVRAKEKIKDYDPNAEIKPVSPVTKPDSLVKKEDTIAKSKFQKRFKKADTTKKR